MADRPAGDISELRALKWITPRPATPARQKFIEFFQAAGLDQPVNVIECSSLVAIRGLLLESDYAALLPARQVQRDVDAGMLAVSPQEVPGTTRDIGLAYRKGWQPTNIQHEYLLIIKDMVGL